MGGELLRLIVDEGTLVRKGDTLALIDHSDLDIQLKQGRANSAAAEAQYRLALRGSREEDLLQAEASFKNARDDAERLEELFKSNSVTQKQLDDGRTRLVVAQQNYEKMKRGSRSEEIDAARARMDQAQAQVDATRKKINDSYVVAPAEGVVTQKAVEEGETVQPIAFLLRITRLDKVHLTIYVTEIELASVKLGQAAKVSIDAFPKDSYPGTVASISPVAEFTPKNIQTKDDRTKLVFGVKIEIENPRQILKPGMPAEAVIDLGQSR